MLFALLDYYNYRRRRGRFSDAQNNEMALGFINEMPVSVVKQLQVGDLIFTQRLNSFWSWASMYYASSNVDHAALYIGEGKVLHTTLAGTKEHSIKTISKGARVLAVHMGKYELRRFMVELDEQRKRIGSESRSSYYLPPKMQLVVAGLDIIHGKYPDRFNIKISFEFFVTLLMFSYALFYMSGYFTSFVLLITSVTYAIICIVKNVMRIIMRQPKPMMSYPDLGLKSFFKAGGLMFTSRGTLVLSDLGVLPLKAFLSLASQGPDDRADDNFEEARKFLRYLIKGWNLAELPQDAENYNSDQQNNEKIEKCPDNPGQSNE